MIPTPVTQKVSEQWQCGMTQIEWNLIEYRHNFAFAFAHNFHDNGEAVWKGDLTTQCIIFQLYFDSFYSPRGHGGARCETIKKTKNHKEPKPWRRRNKTAKNELHNAGTDKHGPASPPVEEECCISATNKQYRRVSKLRKFTTYLSEKSPKTILPSIMPIITKLCAKLASQARSQFKFHSLIIFSWNTLRSQTTALHSAEQTSVLLSGTTHELLMGDCRNTIEICTQPVGNFDKKIQRQTISCQGPKSLPKIEMMGSGRVGLSVK